MTQETVSDILSYEETVSSYQTLMFKTFFIISIFVLYLTLYSKAQLNPYVQSGYTSLTIKLSGEVQKTNKFSTPSYGTVLSTTKPTKFENINDSTLFLSFYAFGPSRTMFNYNDKYLLTYLLPNQSDTLIIHYSDSVQYSMHYRGYFKRVFDSSQEIYNLVKKGFDSDNFVVTKPVDYKKTEEYKNDILKRIHKLTEDLDESTLSSQAKLFNQMNTEIQYKKMLLFDEFPETFLLYTQGKQRNKNSLKSLKSVTERNLSYYEGIVNSSFADTIRMESSFYDLLVKIKQDTLLNLPNILKDGPITYHSKLKQLFGNIFSEDQNLFYDMMIATAYLEEIENDRVLSPKSKQDVIHYFGNKDMGDYILYQNDKKKIEKTNYSSGKYHLPFDKVKDSVLNDILSRYKGKVIVVDFWATWCGPCIENFDKSKYIKDRYVHRDDVVFLYLTDESSDYSKWREYTKIIEGEHYYLYRHQEVNITQLFGIKSIPSYLIFDKNGNLSNKSLSGYMGNEKAVKWIEKALYNDIQK